MVDTFSSHHLTQEFWSGLRRSKDVLGNIVRSLNPIQRRLFIQDLMAHVRYLLSRSDITAQNFLTPFHVARHIVHTPEIADFFFQLPDTFPHYLFGSQMEQFTPLSSFFRLTTNTAKARNTLFGDPERLTQIDRTYLREMVDIKLTRYHTTVADVLLALLNGGAVDDQWEDPESMTAARMMTAGNQNVFRRFHPEPIPAARENRQAFLAWFAVLLHSNHFRQHTYRAGYMISSEPWLTNVLGVVLELAERLQLWKDPSVINWGMILGGTGLSLGNETRHTAHSNVGFSFLSMAIDGGPS